MVSFEVDGLNPTVGPADTFARHFDSSAHGADAVTVDDADLVFTGAYSREGFDLVISRPFESVTVHDYFRHVLRPAIVTSGGASLSGAVVSAMTVNHNGERYAADSVGAGAPKAIGRVEIATGSTSAVRNGQTVTLHAGDLVYKGDSVETGDHSTLALTFLDGTAFSLAANARMVLNEMVYEPNSATNSALLTLVQGSIGFVAGNVAHTGDMKVDTPVATMGIRGTAVHVVIDADRGRTHFSVMREPNGRVGSYVLYDHQDPTHVLATVSDVNQIVTMALVNGVVQIETTEKTAADFSEETNLTQYAFQIFQAGQDHPLRSQLGLDQPGGQNPNQPHGAGPPGSSVPPIDSAPQPGNPETHGAPPPRPPDFPAPSPTPDPLAPPPGSGETTGSLTPTPTPTLGGNLGGGAASGGIQVITAPSGGIIGAADSAVAINLLNGVVDSNPNAKVSVAADASGQPALSVAVVSGAYDAGSVRYHFDADGNLVVDPAQFTSVAPGTTVTLAFNYTAVDSAGATTPVSATLTVDGGAAVTYTPAIVGHDTVKVAPTVVSPEGGDSFALEFAGAPALTQAGSFGSATIDAATGVITYTPAATSGVAGIDTFTVLDTDAEGVTTKTTVTFQVDGGTAALYGAVAVGAGVATSAPTISSPEGGDHFALIGASGSGPTQQGAFGTATIDGATGVITYTPSATPGTGGSDTFTVTDTDALGVVTQATAVFAVDGGTLARYADAVAFRGEVSLKPIVTSPAGGDHFAFSTPSGLANEITGAFGTATIDAATGAISYTPSAGPGQGGADTFIVSDTDALGVTTTATAHFAVDGGPVLNYATTAAGVSGVTVLPQLTSPEGGDHFTLVGGAIGAFGTATLNAATGAITYTPTAAPGVAGNDVYIVSDTDALGAVTTGMAVFAVDGGTAVAYSEATALGDVVVAETPTLVSPKGGDRFAFSTGSHFVTELTGAFGTASIDAATGVITYTATAPQGTGGVDTFTVSDTDALGVTTTTVASFNVDGGADNSYRPLFVDRIAVTSAPVVSSPEGGDQFAFRDASGLRLTEVGDFGTATIDASTGVVIYTPTAAVGASGVDTFTVSDTDALGLETTTTAQFIVDGGTLATYATAITTGAAPATSNPALPPSSIGNSFALDSGAGAALAVTGEFGTASIDATTGVITYTPLASAPLGTAETDAFTVLVTDGLGLTTNAAASFTIDGGSSVAYAPATVSDQPVSRAPAIVSPEGGDRFVFEISAGVFSATETGAHGTATIDPGTGVITYTPNASPGAGSDVFTVVDTDADGAVTTTTANFTVGSTSGHSFVYAPATVGGSSATIAPTLSSPAGGDSFGFPLPGGGVSLTATQPNGTATIDPTNGVITFTPTAQPAPGSTAVEVFQVQDTDALGVTTSATATFTVDGGALVTYATPSVVGTTPVTAAPAIVSPEHGDAFTLQSPGGGGGALTAIGTLGTAIINASTGVVTYTASAGAAGMAGNDTFTVIDTDALGVQTSTSVSFFVDGGPLIAAPTLASIAPGTASAIAGVRLVETGALVSETFTVTLSDSRGLLSATGAGVSGAGTTSLTIRGALDAVNAALATLTDTNSAADDIIMLNASDNLGANAATVAIATRTATGGYVWSAGAGVWNSVSGADWNVPGNGTVPGSGADVTVGSGGGGVVTLGQDQTVNSLSVTSGYVLSSGYAFATTAQATVATGGQLSLAAMTVGGVLMVDGVAIFSGQLTSAGGIVAGVGGLIALNGGAIVNSTISGPGAFETTPGGNGALTNVTIAAGALFVASDNATTSISGAIVNDGTIDVIGGGDQNGIMNLTGATTLSGGGALTLIAEPNDSGFGGNVYLEGDAQTLTISGGTIVGAGVIGNGSLGIVNAGVIDATPEAGPVTLTLNNGGGIVNAGGVLEASGGGTLAIAGVTVNNAGGDITVVDASSTVQVSNALVQGGALNNSAGGTLATSGTSTLDGSTVAGAITIAGVYTASDNAVTNLAGAIIIDGTLELVGGADQNGFINLSADVTLTGAGTVTMSDRPNDSGFGGAAYLEGNGETLTNSGAGIQGTGIIGNGGLAIVNQSTIDATPEGGTSALTLNGSGGIINSRGVLEATLGGRLSISAMTVNNAFGQIRVGDAASAVDIANTTVQGGTLDNSAGGTLETIGAATLDGSTAAGAVTIAGVYTASDNASTTLAGTINLAGAINLIGGADQNGFVNLSADTTLTGAGGLVMINHPNDSGFGGAAILEGNGVTLTNGGGGVKGTGLIGNGSLTLINQSVIDATPEGGSRTLTLNNSGGVNNRGGLLEATAGGTLTLAGVTISNAGGAITVGDFVSTVELASATISGGALNNTRGGALIASGVTTIDGSASSVAIAGVFTVSNNSQTNLEGAIVDGGRIIVVGGADQNGAINLVGDTLLTGVGAVVMDGKPNDSGFGGNAYLEGSGATLTNSIVIQGTGVIGNGSLAIINNGLIAATPESGAATLIVNNGGGIVNAHGALEAAGGATLSIQGVTVNNALGDITVADRSSTVQLSDATIAGGELNNLAGGTLATAGTATLDGSTSAGALAIDGLYLASDGAVTNLAGAISIKGTLELIGGADANGFINLTSDTTLSGSGALVMISHPNDSGFGGAAYLEGSGATLTNSGGGIFGTGIIGNSGLKLINASVIDATPEGGSNTLTLNNSGGAVNLGTLEATHGGVLVVDSPLSGPGRIVIGADSTVELGVAANETTTFNGDGATLKLDTPSSYSGDIVGFGDRDTLVLKGVVATSATPSHGGSETNLTVHLSSGGSLSYTLVGDYTRDTFKVVQSGGDSLLSVTGRDHGPFVATAASAGGMIGGGDTFVFKPNMPDAIIPHFHASASAGPVDVLDLHAFHFADYQALLRDVTDTPGGDAIALDGHTLTLEGVHDAQLHASLFLL